MIDVVLVDDEKPALIELEYLLKKESDIRIIDTFTDPEKALENIAQMQPDVVFLDIEMPIINGLNVAIEIIEMNKNIDIVFVTEFNEYAINAFEVNALDYLLKPVLKSRLNKCLIKLREVRKNKQDSKSSLLNTVKHIGKHMYQDTKIVAWDDGEIILLKPEDVLYIETDSGNASIVTKNKKYKTRTTLASFEERLADKGFFRCHRCYIVNINLIKKISPMFNNYVIILEDCDYQVPVSRSNEKKLKSFLESCILT